MIDTTIIHNTMPEITKYHKDQNYTYPLLADDSNNFAFFENFFISEEDLSASRDSRDRSIACRTGLERVCVR